MKQIVKLIDVDVDGCGTNVETRERIDNPHLIPVTPQLMSGLHAAIRGELGNI